MALGWHLIDIRALVGEATMSGNVGGGFPVPFLVTSTAQLKGKSVTSTSTSYKWNPDLSDDSMRGGADLEQKLWGALAGYKPSSSDDRYRPTQVPPVKSTNQK